jgi:hypothetical protein
MGLWRDTTSACVWALTAPVGSHWSPRGRLGFAAARVSTKIAQRGATPAHAGWRGRARSIAPRNAFAGLPEPDRAITRQLFRVGQERRGAVGRGHKIPLASARPAPLRTLQGPLSGGHSRAALPPLEASAVRNFERAGVSQAVATRLSGDKTPSIYGRCRTVDETNLWEVLRRTESPVASDQGRTVIALSAAREGRA